MTEIEIELEQTHMILELKQRILTQYRHLTTEEIIKANGNAILAIEKQYPLSAQKTEYEDVFKCPKCKEMLFRDKENLIHFCPFCGQAIKFIVSTDR